MSTRSADKQRSAGSGTPVDLSKGFARAYVHSLLTVASLTVIGQAMMSRMAAEHDRDADIMRQVDRQRLLCEDLISDATALEGDGSLQERARVEAELSRNLVDWHKVESAIESGDNALGLPDDNSPDLHEIYAGLRPNYLAVTEAVEAMMLNYRSTAPLPGEYDHQLRKIVLNQSGLIQGLNALSEHYRTESEARFQRLKGLDLGVGFGVLVVLALQFMIVFRPKVKILQDTSAELNDLNKSLKASNDVLTAQREELESQQERLRAQQTELELQNEKLVAQSQELETLNATLDQNHEVYAEAARRMEELFQVIPVACFSFGRDGCVSDWNRACQEVFGKNAYAASGAHVRDILSRSMRDDEIEQILTQPFSGKAVEGLVWQQELEDGSIRWIMSSVFPIRNGEMDIVCAVCANVDITDRTLYAAQLEESMVQLNEYSLELEMQKNELEEANDKLESLATTDGLTGLRNHRSFQERLENDFIRAAEEGLPLSLLLLDVDNFKLFNDTYGHPEGDKVLKSVAAILFAYASEPFTAARYGGEEFVVVLPGVDAEQAIQIAYQILAAIEASKPTGVLVTASLGMATWTPGLRSRAELIAQADKALYKSKAEGRNRLTLASSLWLDEEKSAA